MTFWDWANAHTVLSQVDFLFLVASFNTVGVAMARGKPKAPKLPNGPH